MMLFPSLVSTRSDPLDPFLNVPHLSPHAHHMRHGIQVCFSSVKKTTAIQNSTLKELWENDYHSIYLLLIARDSGNSKNSVYLGYKRPSGKWGEVRAETGLSWCRGESLSHFKQRNWEDWFYYEKQQKQNRTRPKTGRHNEHKAWVQTVKCAHAQFPDNS